MAPHSPGHQLSYTRAGEVMAPLFTRSSAVIYQGWWGHGTPIHQVISCHIPGLVRSWHPIHQVISCHIPGLVRSWHPYSPGHQLSYTRAGEVMAPPFTRSSAVIYQGWWGHGTPIHQVISCHIPGLVRSWHPHSPGHQLSYTRAGEVMAPPFTRSSAVIYQGWWGHGTPIHQVISCHIPGLVRSWHPHSPGHQLSYTRAGEVMAPHSPGHQLSYTRAGEVMAPPFTRSSAVIYQGWWGHGTPFTRSSAVIYQGWWGHGTPIHQVISCHIPGLVRSWHPHSPGHQLSYTRAGEVMAPHSPGHQLSYTRAGEVMAPPFTRSSAVIYQGCWSHGTPIHQVISCHIPGLVRSWHPHSPGHQLSYTRAGEVMAPPFTRSSAVIYQGCLVRSWHPIRQVISCHGIDFDGYADLWFS